MSDSLGDVRQAYGGCIELAAKSFPLGGPRGYSSDGCLLSIQFIGQLGLKQPVLRQFSRSSDHLGQGRSQWVPFYGKNGDRAGFRA